MYKNITSWAQVLPAVKIAKIFSVVSVLEQMNPICTLLQRKQEKTLICILQTNV